MRKVHWQGHPSLYVTSVACVYKCDFEIGEKNALMGLKASMVSHSWPHLQEEYPEHILSNDQFCLFSLRFVSLLVLRPPADEHVFPMLGIAILPLPKTCLYIRILDTHFSSKNI